MRSLLSLYRGGATANIDDMVKGHELKEEELGNLFKHVKSPLFYRESEDDIFTAV